MNCRPKDLARIVGVPSQLKLNDKIVQLADHPAIDTPCGPAWLLETSVFFVMDVIGRDAAGVLFFPGDHVEVAYMLDANLRPIRGLGDDTPDVTLAWMPVPLLEVAHG